MQKFVKTLISQLCQIYKEKKIEIIKYELLLQIVKQTMLTYVIKERTFSNMQCLVL